MQCRNINLAAIPFNFNKVCLCYLSYSIYYTQNKALYNKVPFGTNFTDFLCFHSQEHINILTVNNKSHIIIVSISKYISVVFYCRFFSL